MLRTACKRERPRRWSPVTRYRVVEAVACEQRDGTFIHMRLECVQGDAPGWRSVVFLPLSQNKSARARVERDLKRLGITWDAITARGEQAFVGTEFNGDAVGTDWVAIRERTPVTA